MKPCDFVHILIHLLIHSAYHISISLYSNHRFVDECFQFGLVCSVNIVRSQINFVRFTTTCTHNATITPGEAFRYHMIFRLGSGRRIVSLALNLFYWCVHVVVNQTKFICDLTNRVDSHYKCRITNKLFFFF